MPPFGKIQGALTVATQETTLALANVNVDFSLVRIEAPAEYRRWIYPRNGSKTRRHFPRHSTIYAKFVQGVRPSGLQYCAVSFDQSQRWVGLRPIRWICWRGWHKHLGCSNFWKECCSNPLVSMYACEGMECFGGHQYLGINCRGKEKRTLDLGWKRRIPLRMFTTGRVSITREHLAEWDASTCAWLRAADTAKEFNQTQLRLIIENFNIPVNRDLQVYNSVTLAWRTAMSTIVDLIQGVSQSLSNEAVLLGLLAWHLYPDLIVLGSVPKCARQNDPLIAPGATVTLGLQENESENSRSVYILVIIACSRALLWRPSIIWKIPRLYTIPNIHWRLMASYFSIPSHGMGKECI